MIPSLKVLLVDDEPKFIDSLAKLLKRKNIQAKTAYDGRQGVDMAKAEKFDTIVLDLRMPELDGLATLRAIREFDSVTPILILTGEIDLQRVSQALKAGVDEVLLKPCPLDTMVTAIENACERKACAGEIRKAAD